MIDHVPPRTTVVRATAIGAGAALTAALPLTFPADGGPSGLDAAVADPITAAVSPGLAQVLVTPSNAPVVLVALLAAVGWFAVRRRWWAAVTMLVVPELVLVINTVVLKPLWDRRMHDYLAYPSGHTVHMVAVATTFACLVTTLTARVAIATLTVLALVAIVPGMVVLGYHRPTDVLGGAAAAAALALALCLLAERLRPGTR
ncbi:MULTISPECIES: phosphatase PAP2 family protein [unclassified Nocardia]|uniref:phosphatase PAP2 family protein n=1 Tax=unclassified Nocardia TaxID=2637762 RepID=UPI0033B9EC65